MNINDWYSKVNAAWPETVPPMTSELAVKAAKQLYTVGVGKRFTGNVELTSGNRFTWIRRGVMYVNPDRRERSGNGWHALVHDLSHYAHRVVNPSVKPHTGRHARIEIRMIKKVIDAGWLQVAQAKVEQPVVVVTKEDERRKKYERVLKGIERWESKARRAQTHLKKLNRSKRAFERHLNQGGN